MDAVKTRQKYKQYACLCFSVMGQRKFRVSMGVLIAPPEAGDASVNIVPNMKKHNAISDNPSKTFASTISGKSTINQCALKFASHYTCSSIMNNDSHNEIVSMKSDVLNKMSNSTIHESCQFPYYRSNKNIGECPDAVLVKDVGVSCMLLKQNVSEISVADTRTITKQLRKEYCDLSDITNKISTYTKDILNHLSMRKQRKQELLKNLVSSKHAIASQYLNSKGNLCLKLRLFNNAQTQCSSHEAVKNCNNVLYRDQYVVKKAQQSKKESKHHLLDREEITNEENEKSIQTISKTDVKTNTPIPPSASTSSICDYLMMKKKKPSNEHIFNCRLLKVDNMQKYRNPKNFNNSNDCKDDLRRCSPVIFTNWKEISQSKQYKNKSISITSNASQQTTNAKNKPLTEKLFNNKTINSVPEATFHTVNIRIIKDNKKPL